VWLLAWEPATLAPALGAAGWAGLLGAAAGAWPGLTARCLCRLPLLSLDATCRLLLEACLPCSLCDAVLPAAPVPVWALAAFSADVRGPSLTVFRAPARCAAVGEPVAAAELSPDAAARRAATLFWVGPVPATLFWVGSGPDMLLLKLRLSNTALLLLLLLVRCNDCLPLMPPAGPSLLWRAPVWLLRSEAEVLPAAHAEAVDMRGLDSLRVSSAVHMLMESIERLMLLAWRGWGPGRWNSRGRGCFATGDVTPCAAGNESSA
jgi:hypothetical protein